MGPKLRTEATIAELRAVLARHIGHTLRCVRETTGRPAAPGGYQIDTLALRCDDCGEVVFETLEARRRERAG
jgi:hypothetical protein